jgi:serine/threonine protein kinase
MNAEARSEHTRGAELETLVELGEGGMATAHLARSLGPGGFERLLVVKRLIPGLRDTPEAIERFVTEARIAAQLHHANIVGTQRIDWDEVGPFIVLDYVEGGTFDELVEASAARGETLPVPVVLRIALDALSGLCFVHEARDGSGRPLEILHRDISLQNVLVGVHDGIARLSDFGVAKSTFSIARTDPGCFVGKLLYFPPEYLLGGPIGPTLDVYALGVTLWLALTGTTLWPGSDEARLARSIVSEGVPDLAEYVSVAPELRAFVAKACAHESKDRFQSAREMAAVLEHFDRDYGWVGSHADVARTVDRLLGTELRQRRERIARLLPGLGSRDTDAKLALSLRRTEADPRPHIAKPARPAPPQPSAVRRFAPHAVGVALILALAAALASSGPGEPAQGPPTIVRSQATPPPAVAREPPAPEPVVTPAQTVPLPSATLPADPLPPATEVAASSAPPRAQSPGARPTKRVAEPAPAAPSDGGLRRKNPYR